MAGCPLRGHCWRMPPQGAEARPGPALCLGFPDCRGAKSPHASGSARFSCSSCLRLSCRTTASSQPTVLTPYPLAQQCSPVQLRVRPRYARCMRMAAFPYNRPTAFAPLYWRGMLRHTCTWSGMAWPSTTARPMGSQWSRRLWPMSWRSVPKMAFCRYCGPMTMWYRPYHRTGLWSCHARLVVSPFCGLGGSTPGETTFLFPNQRRNGRACSSLTARGGGLPIGVILFTFHRV
jgi:hypothetical protein